MLFKPPDVHGHLTCLFLAYVFTFPFHLILALDREECAVTRTPEVIGAFLVIMIGTLTIETKEETKLLHGTLELLGRYAKG